MRLAASCLIFLTILGCDREKPTPPPKRAPVLTVEIARVTPLPPDRRTHVAPTGGGQTFWVQEAEGGRETVFAISDGGLPAATKFSSAAVLDAIGKRDARGSLQSLVAGPDGKLYFYFTGGKGRQLIAAFGRFSPDNGQTQVLADTAALARDSRLGDSLALARGSVVRVGDVLWLWLRHDDGYALLSLDVTRGGVLRQTFEQVRAAGEEVRLTSSAEDLARGPGNSLIYLDRRRGRLWKIGTLGEAAPLRELGDLPPDTTAPAIDERGRLVMFAPDAASSREQTLNLATRPSVEYPALVIVDGEQRTVLGRDSFTAPEKLNVRTLAPPRLVRDRSGWLAYDTQTGELLRLRVVER